VLARLRVKRGCRAQWWSATVVRQFPDSSLRIAWDDAEKRDLAKLPSELQVIWAKEEGPPRYCVGDQVLARYQDVPVLLREGYDHRGGPWFPATIAQANEDGTLTVTWRDRDCKNRVKRPDELWPWRALPDCDAAAAGRVATPLRRRRHRSGGHRRGPIHPRLFEEAQRRATRSCSQTGRVRSGGAARYMWDGGSLQVTLTL